MNPAEGSLLVVDDDDVTRGQLVRHLTRHGYEVTGVADGAAALARIEAGGQELVLLDVVMDGVSGLEVLEQARRKHPASDLPIIMATSKDASPDVVEALRLGANDYVIKPFDYPVVLARVQTQLSLKRSMDQVRRLEASLAQRNAELEAANERMSRDLAAARRVQESLLPTGPLSLPGIVCAWRFRPCTELAGDLLNVVPLGGGHAALYVLDVVGHGAAAALLAVMVTRFLGQLLLPGREMPGPAEVGRCLHVEFPWNDHTSQFFTLLHGVLDLGTGEFRFIAGGHPGPIHLPRDGPARQLNLPGYPVGLGDGEYEEHLLHLGPGDRLFLYSDGLADASPSLHERFGEARVLEAIEQGRTLPLADSVNLLLRAAEQWCGAAAPLDDITILAVERT